MSTTTIGAGSDTLTLGVSDDAYLGNAQFTVSLDGQQVGNTLTVASLNDGFSSDTVNVLADLAPGVHTATINFLNDAYGGTMDADRNLYVDGAVYDGSFIPSAARELQVSGPSTIGFLDQTPLATTNSPTTTTIGSGPDTLVLSVSQDAYQGSAQFTVSLDGQQVGDVLTASSLHSSGTSDTINVLASLAPGQHTVAVSFLNDAYNGTADTDRNLYVDSATYDGVSVDGATFALLSTGSGFFRVADTTFNPGGSLVVAAGATVTAEGDQLAGVGVSLNGDFNGRANLTLNNATVGSLALVDNDLTNGSSAYSGHLDIYGQSAISGNTTIGGSRPVSPGFLDAYVHGADGVLTVHGASLGGSSTLTINGDEGSTVENDGRINIQGGYTTGSMNIQADLEGTGTLSGGADIASSPATIRLGGDVGAGQTIEITDVRLQLDQPMQFAGTLTGFTDGRGLPGQAPVAVPRGVTPSLLTLANETVTGTSFAQSPTGVGDLSVFTQDQETGAAGATLDFHVTGAFASDAFTFTNNAAAQSATIFLASSVTT